MVDPVDGQHLLCMWQDCQRAGKTEHQIVVREPTGVDPVLVVVPHHTGATSGWKFLHYVFCCHRHAEYWRYSHRSLFNLPPGSKGSIL